MVLRRVALSVAASAGVAFDRLDDLALAVTEGAVAVMDRGRAATVVMELANADPGIVVSMRGVGAMTPWPPAWSSGLAAAVLSAATSDLEADFDGTARTLRFSVDV